MNKGNKNFHFKRSMTQDKMTAHDAKAVLVTCMDFRFINDEMSHMKDKGYDINFDCFVLAGVSIGINQKKYPEWAKALLDHIELSKKLHHTKKVVLLDHLDCGAYRLFGSPFTTEEEERELHVKELKIAAEKIRTKFPDLKVVCKIMHTNRIVEKVLVLK